MTGTSIWSKAASRDQRLKIPAAYRRKPPASFFLNNAKTASIKENGETRYR
jgi:hypothetical protein